MSATIRALGDPVLRTAADPVRSFDADLRRLVASMFEAMYAATGVGLAANQIGVGSSVFVMDCEGIKAVLVNPVLHDLSAATVEDLEGCLSLPGRQYPTIRAAVASVTGQDEHGEPVTLSGTGQVARCLQHEADHLDGKVYLDRLVGETRRTALRDLRAVR